MTDSLKRLFGIFVVLTPVFIVLVIWLFMAPISTRFADFSTSLLSIGRITGLVGLALYALSLILHVRITILRKIISGADICRLHHDFGSWAVISLMIHPLALAGRFVSTDMYYAAKFLLPKDNLTNLVGWFALMMMIVAIFATYYYNKNHTIWLWIHRSMIVAYIGSFAHLLFVTSDTSTSPLLKYYLMLLMLAGIVAFAYQRLIRYFPSRPETPEACEK